MEKQVDYRHSDMLMEIILNTINKKSLHFFGDSHSQTFSGLQNVIINHIGPATAFNLIKKGSRTRGREKLMEGIKILDPKECAIGLSFGEIDCRAHIVKKSIEQRLPIKTLVKKTVENYCRVIREIQELGYTVFVLGLAGSGNGLNFKTPRIGRERERNLSMILFNNFMRERSESENFFFVDIQDIVIDFTSLKTRHAFLTDGCHLNRFPNTSKDLQCAILSRINQKIGLTPQPSFEEGISFARLNHAQGADFNLSSTYKRYPKKGRITESDKFFFHTSKGFNEYIEIDLGQGFLVDEIIIHNRKDLCFERANSMVAEICLLGDKSGQKVEKDIPASMGFLSGKELTASATFAPLLCQKLRIRSNSNTYLHFSYIEINGLYPC